uniref:Uncharacterized protein n=1 Tax=Latimeria chalumnae TaxID=7897 RepID=M3XKE5_LATCH
MNSCLVPEYPAVMVALEHLNEIEIDLKKNLGLGEEDIHHLVETAKAVEELEQSRRNVRELLEVETIENSKLRYMLRHFQDGITWELEAFVSAAHKSNTFQLNQLQTQMRNITKEIELLERKRILLEEENTALYPEQEKIRAVYDDLVDVLNQQMLEKASQCIIVNELINKVREAQLKIKNLYNGIEDQEDDIIDERKCYAEEKEQLMKEVESMQLKTKPQKQKNLKLRKDLDILTSDLSESEGKVLDQKQMILKLERQIFYLENTEERSTKELEWQNKRNEKLVSDVIKLKDELAKLTDQFDKETAVLRNKILQLDEEIERNEVTYKELKKEAKRLKALLLERQKTEDEEFNKKQDTAHKLRKSKSLLEENLERLAKLRTEIRGMEQEILMLTETSRGTIEMCSKQLEETRKQLKKEKQER